MEASISSIIIDGYNLIGIHHTNLEAERRQLIELLIKYREKKGHSVTVVFDGWKGGGRTESSSVSGGVKIIYSRLGEKADAVIKKIISTDRREWIVVSSDREIASYAWSVNSIPVPAETFMGFAGITETNDPYETDEDEPEQEAMRKGNPNRPSRKERALQRALSKL